MEDHRDRVRRYYAAAPEHDRLATDDGWLERERTIELLRRGYRGTLVDLSPELLEHARRRAVRRPLYHASDSDDLRRMVDTRSRVLRPGRILLGTFSPEQPGPPG